MDTEETESFIKPRVKTFGNFDVFVNDCAIFFSNKKAKEMLALLIDRKGGILTTSGIIDVLWEERAYDENTKALYRIALKNMRDTLRKSGCDNILIEARGQRAINVHNVECDYYNFLKGQTSEWSPFTGEYMSEYSWGEMTLGTLTKLYYGHY